MRLLLLLTVLIISDYVLAKKPSGCETKLEPLSTPWPKYPSPEQAKGYLRGSEYAHVIVEGTVRVSFTVLTEGNVKDLEIISSEYRLAGRDAKEYGSEHFKGFFDSSVFRTLKNWKYKTIDKPCFVESIFEWKSQTNTE